MKKMALATALGLICATVSTLSIAQVSAQGNTQVITPGVQSNPVLTGQVISRTALFQQVAVPSQTCANTPVLVQGPKSGAGAMMGAIAGAAVGSQVGGGQGQALATMAGLVGGAMLGDNVEKPAPAQTYNQTTCTTQSAYENRLIGYQVVYEFAGKQYTVQLPQDPGPTLALQVSPAMVANAPVAAPPVTMAPPMVVTQPQVIYAPPTVVYGSPYYGNPYPFSTSINLGWGYRGGYGGGRHWR
jgi:uncharacterized protein YcfJ